jgi:hypothetical protein
MSEGTQTLAHSASQRGPKGKQREEVLQLLRASLELPGWSPLSRECLPLIRRLAALLPQEGRMGMHAPMDF